MVTMLPTVSMIIRTAITGVVFRTFMKMNTGVENVERHTNQFHIPTWNPVIVYNDS